MELKGYLEIEDCNFIGMDWSEMASGQTLPYPADYPYISQVQVPKAGQNVGYTYHLVKLINFKNILCLLLYYCWLKCRAFIDFLIETSGTSIKQFHLIGHSLGSHVVGWAGALSHSRGTISRITGLDPAGPLFFLNNTETRLDPSDADFVDIIHTDSGSFLEGQLSFLEPIGHAVIISIVYWLMSFNFACTSNQIRN